MTRRRHSRRFRLRAKLNVAPPKPIAGPAHYRVLRAREPGARVILFQQQIPDLGMEYRVVGHPMPGLVEIELVVAQ